VRSRVAYSSDSYILDLFVCTELRRRRQVELDMVMGLVCTHNIDGVGDDGDGVCARSSWSRENVFGGVGLEVDTCNDVDSVGFQAPWAKVWSVRLNHSPNKFNCT
jgi:hypothetical protein